MDNSLISHWGLTHVLQRKGQDHPKCHEMTWTDDCWELDPSPLSQGGRRRASYTTYGMDSRIGLAI